ncbi:hypothetical protein L204_101777 [Cryptococcus depauperatus]|nr:hypothetical protein L204_04253 [Cryptococcus depauperatus CBS 7855]
MRLSLLALTTLSATANVISAAPVEQAHVPRDVEGNTSIVSLKNISTLSSLVVYNPSSAAGSSSSGMADSNASAKPKPVEILSSGDSVVFNPTPSTTLSFIGNVSTSSAVKESGSRATAAATSSKSATSTGRKEAQVCIAGFGVIMWATSVLLF